MDRLYSGLPLKRLTFVGTKCKISGLNKSNEGLAGLAGQVK